MRWNSPPRTVFVPYDVDNPFPEALQTAAAVAPASSAVIVLYVVDEAPVRATIAEPRIELTRQQLDVPLQRLRTQLDAVGLQHARMRVAFGPPSETIVEAIEREQPDLVVMPTNARRGLRRLVLGSVTEYVIRHVHRPVLVLPPSP